MSETVRRDPFKSRIHEIDFLRGLLMCLVIMDHLFNLFMSFNKTWCGGADAIANGTAKEPFLTIYHVFAFYWDNPVRMVVRWLCLGSFCFVSGISCAFSKNNWKRAGQMICLWFFILVVSNIMQGIVIYNDWHLGITSFRVDFNIIGVLAWSTLIYCFIQDKHWKWMIILGAIALAIHPLCVVLSWTDWGKAPTTYAIPLFSPVKGGLYQQADFMSLFPYLAFFLGGALLSKFTYSVERRSYFKQHEWERPICFIGRHSLIIYLTHFLLLIGIFNLVGLFIK